MVDSETTIEVVAGATSVDEELKPDNPEVEIDSEGIVDARADSEEVVTVTVVVDSVSLLATVVSATETVDLLTLGVTEEELDATLEETGSLE